MTRTPQDIWLAPSLLSADWARAGEQVRELQDAGVEWLHFDAMDGHFVPNLSFGAIFLRAMRPHCDMHFDAHLMVSNPADRLDEFLQAGAQSISVHVENQPHLHKLIWHIKDAGAMGGAVLNPATPVEALNVILPDLDYVLVMSVNPGFGGQKFLPLALPKIEKLARWRAERGLNFKIQVDGGVSATNVEDVVRAGADVIVSGSAILGNDAGIQSSVAAMRTAIERAFASEIRS